MQKTSGVGWSDFACQKSSTWRSSGPYGTFAAVGGIAGAGNVFSSFFSGFLSSFFSWACPPVRATRANGSAKARNLLAVMVFSGGGRELGAVRPRPYHRTGVPATGRNTTPLPDPPHLIEFRYASR